MQKVKSSSKNMNITFPSWDFITDFNSDTQWRWSLSLHRTLLLALSSYKSSPVSGRFSQSKKGKLSLISWIKFAVCYGKDSQRCGKLSSSCVWYPLYRKKVQLTELEAIFMRNVPGFANSKWQDLWKGKPPDLLLTFWLLHASYNASQKQDTKQQQTGKNLEMTEYLLL